MSDRCSWTIALLALGAFALAPATAAGASGSEGTRGASSVVDHRPEGMTPTPYDLETFETSVGTTPIVAGDPATFELFGFKLGMSVREADRNAKRRHLRFNGGNGTNPSFDGRVEIAAANLLGRNPPKLHARVSDRSSHDEPRGAAPKSGSVQP